MSYRSRMSTFTTALLITLGTTLTFIDNARSLPETIAQTTQQERTPRTERQNRVRGANSQEESLIQRLNLTDDQRQRMNAIRQKYQGQLTSLRESVKTNRQELNTLLSQNASDSAIRAKHQQISQTRQQITNIGFESFLEMRQVLTPAQRGELARLMQEKSESRQRGNNR